MANNDEFLAASDSEGFVTFWSIKMATPAALWSRSFPSKIFTCACLTNDSVILGSIFGELIVVQNGAIICSINAHSGSVMSITKKSNTNVSPQLCISTGEDGKIVVFTASGSVIKNEFVGDYLLTGVQWVENGSVYISVYGDNYVIKHPIS
jgi:hypothetical protein